MAAILDLPEMRARVYRWSVTDYTALAEGNPAFQHYELIRGIIVEKMPKTPLHAFLTKALYDFFHREVGQGFVVRKEDPMRLADSMPEPDLSVVRGARGDFRSEHPTTAELIVEVAVTSVAPDRESASIYAEASVTEYWIILAGSEQVEVYRQPENGVYQKKRLYGRGEIIEGVSVIANGVAVDTFFA